MVGNTVVATGGGYVIGQQWSRNTFYAQSKFWQFYKQTTGTNSGKLCFKTSTDDGATWSSETATSYTIGSFAMCLSGTTISVVYEYGTFNYSYYTGIQEIRHNYGTLNSDGTISWNGTTTTVYQYYIITDTDGIYEWLTEVGYPITPSICRDSNGYTWICFTEVVEYYDHDNQNAPIGGFTQTLVKKSSGTDGSIGSLSDSTSDYGSSGAQIFNLSSGKVVIFWYNAGVTSKLYSGSSWGVNKYYTASGGYPSISTYFQYSCTSYGDYFYYCYSGTHSGTCKLFIAYLTISTDTWSSTTYLVNYPDSNGFNVAVAQDSSNGNLYLFCNTSSTLYVLKRISGTWDGSLTSLGTDSTINVNANWNVSEFATSNKLGLVYLKSDNNLRFLYYTTSTFPTQYSGFHVYYGGATVELCLVANGDGNPAIAYNLKVRKGGTTYELYLVNTDDSNASKVRVRTSDGTKAIRKKT